MHLHCKNYSLVSFLWCHQCLVRLFPFSLSLLSPFLRLPACRDKEVLVGHPAVAQQEGNPSNTVYDAKRFIGKRFTQEELNSEAKRYQFKVNQMSGSYRWKFSNWQLQLEYIIIAYCLDSCTVYITYCEPSVMTSYVCCTDGSHYCWSCVSVSLTDLGCLTFTHFMLLSPTCQVYCNNTNKYSRPNNMLCNWVVWVSRDLWAKRVTLPTASKALTTVY